VSCDLEYSAALSYWARKYDSAICCSKWTCCSSK